MILRQARESDFAHLETFVWQAIFPAFDQAGLNDAQRAENDALVENARTEVISSMGQKHHGVFVAIDPRTRTLAGYIIADASPRAYAEIRCLIVKRAYWGKGVAAELLALATDFIGRDRAISLSVRHYNERALAFFAKHDFHNTGETAGRHAIPRLLLLREAYEETTPPAVTATPEASVENDWLDFPTAADEPVFEELPDYRLRTDEEPLFTTGANTLAVDDPDEVVPEESSLSEAQLTELEAFIARARARKGKKEMSAVPKAPISPKTRPQPVTPPTPASKHPEVVFEIDYGNASPLKENGADRKPEIASPGPPVRTEKAVSERPASSFQFAFDADETTAHLARNPNAAGEEAPVPEKKPDGPEPRHAIGLHGTTKTCPDCRLDLPAVARFCFNCGHPQPEVADQGEKAPEEDVLVLEDLPEVSASGSTATAQAAAYSTAASAPGTADRPSPEPSVSPQEKGNKKVSLADLKQAFRDYLQDRIQAYFGERKLRPYLQRLEEDAAFQQVRDGSLVSLVSWLNERPDSASSRNRRRDVLADLAEYFIVETAGDLSGNVLPQRLLRYQSINWESADLFRMVMDYLDFDAETEQVYTDFVVMPSRALKNATRSFLRAARDERIFFICDQSLISAAKNGFAITDSGIYWKNVLQPPGAATFTTMKPPRLEQGHVVIDGQFFDAGARLNLKVAVLLDKLRRM